MKLYLNSTNIGIKVHKKVTSECDIYKYLILENKNIVKMN